MGYGDVLTSARRRRPVNFNDPNALSAEQGNIYGKASGYGEDASQTYLDKAKSFDASTALNDYAKGAFANVSQGLKQQIAAMGGAAVGQGRFDTGYRDEDEQGLTRNIMADFTNNLSMQSMNAAGMQQRNTESIGQFGQNQQQMATDLLMSRREELENNSREEAERKRRKRSGIGAAIGGVLGGAGGFLVGGPMGAMAGYQMGAGAGGAFG